MKRIEWTRMLWIVFYFCWMMYALIVVPGMGDWVYFTLCLVAGLTMVGSGLAMSDYTPAQPQHKHIQFNRRAKLQHNGGRHTEQEWRALCVEYKNRCACCNKRAKLTKDHVVSIYRGGTDNIDNIQPLCQSCNSSKGTRTVDHRKK